MGVCGCLCGDADAYDMSMPAWMVWSDHPVRQQFDVVMDLGEGSFAQVSQFILQHQSANIHATYRSLNSVYHV